MTLSISTHWNASSHNSGELMIQEVLDLGINCVELSYDLTIDLVLGVKKMVDEKSITVTSLHNFCPVPVSAPYGHPELHSLCSPDNRDRTMAVTLTTKSIEFAAATGAKALVVHAGRIDTRHKTRDLIALAEQGKMFDEKYEKIKIKLMMQRDKKAQNHIDQFHRSIEELLPPLQDAGVQLAIENLPSWETVPSEAELEAILKQYDSPFLRYWHDIGHGQIRQNLGFIGQQIWLDKLSPFLAGMHIHDVTPPAQDHLMPPHGEVNFSIFKPFIKPDTILVLEPAPGTPPELVKEGAKIIREMMIDK